MLSLTRTRGRHCHTGISEGSDNSTLNIKWLCTKQQFLLTIKNRLQFAFKMFQYDKQYIKNYNEEGNTSQCTTWELGISQLWCFSEDVSEQKNLSRSFHTKINILYFLTQTHSTKIILARKGTSSWFGPWLHHRDAPRQLAYQTFWCIEGSLWCHGIIQGHKWFFKQYILWWTCSFIF